MRCLYWIFVGALTLSCAIAFGNDKSLTEENQKRTDELLRSVESYDMTIPSVVDTTGDFITYDIHSPPKRTKRSTSQFEDTVRHDQREILDESDISEYRIFYKFSAFGKEFHFDLTLNTGFLAEEFYVEYLDGTEGRRQADGVANCYYIGHSREPYLSTAAISNCYGLNGVFSTDDDDYFVEPLWNHTSSSERQGHPHVVYKRSSLKLPSRHAHCGVKDKNSIDNTWMVNRSKWHPESTKKIPNIEDQNQVIYRLHPKKVYDVPDGAPQDAKRRQKRDVIVEMPERTVETLVVVDKRMFEFHKSKEYLLPYVLTIMNIVAKLYHDPSIGNRINIVVSKLVILTEDQTNLSISFHADRSLDSFCKWQHRLNETSDTTHDNAVLITRYDICTYKNKPCGTLGLAPVAGMCEDERSCSINEDIGLASAFTIAHEIGHNFGMQHDGAGNLCGTPGNEPARIMAARLTADTNPFLWSNCSREYISDFLDSGRGSCLDNRLSKQEQDSMPKSRLTVQHSTTKQCHLMFHNQSRHCKPEETCRELWCTNEENKCVTNSIPAAEGSPCINDTYAQSFRGKCYRRSCVPLHFRPRPVDGGWGAWSAWSECSRTCGGGVQFKDRVCDSPVPSDGGKFCVGDRKHYKSCNIKPCASGPEDFRQKQCGAFDTIPFRGRFFKWIPFNGVQSNPCALNCMADGFNFYTERASKVTDGTPCYPDRPDMCINGECHHVGCDGDLGSQAIEDKCRVCDGDGTSCQTISGMVDRSLPKGAYQEILKIPKGAMNIQVQEAYESGNYLALRSEDGPFYINGDWTIDWPRKFTVAGTIFHYERQNDTPEIMRAIGPTSENLVVMLLLQEDNQGVQYEYNVPYNATAGHHNSSLFTWTHSRWSPCSHSCGRGISTSTAECIHKFRKTIVDESYCSPQPKPSHHFRHCSPEPCPTEWYVGEWGECSQSCGGGHKTRTAVCKQRISQEEEVILDDAECDTKRPVTEKSCRKANCPSMWVAENWTECSKWCGRGEMVRHVYCMTSDRAMYLDESQCQVSQKPATIATCVKRSCPHPEWKPGEWNECTGECNNGWQRRTVQCVGHDGQETDRCDQADRPQEVRRCELSCQYEEEENLQEECVDNYNFAYCPLVLKFQFCDREYFLRMCCKTCQIAARAGDG